jgi:prepilin-type N-terminal cleavage/methylation domain-containing protein
MKRRKGFTLIELLIVVLILGALAAIAIPKIATSTAKANACKTNQDIISSQAEMYYANQGSYPSLAVLVADVNYFPEGVVPECPSAGTYSLSGTTHRADCTVSGH